MNKDQHEETSEKTQISKMKNRQNNQQKLEKEGKLDEETAVDPKSEL